MKEKNLLKTIQIYAGQQGWIALRLNSGKAWQGQYVAGSLINLKAIELCPKGTSDLLIIMPNKIAFIETKIHPKKPTPEQVNFLKIIRELGHIGEVVYSLEDFIKAIKKDNSN